MSKNLVIVESPAKAKTISKYLGKDFDVMASYGHVRDLVPKVGAVDPDNNFSMKYQVIMNRLMEPEGEPDITRGTIEGRISASPITVLQLYGKGDDLQAYII